MGHLLPQAQARGAVEVLCKPEDIQAENGESGDGRGRDDGKVDAHNSGHDRDGEVCEAWHDKARLWPVEHATRCRELTAERDIGAPHGVQEDGEGKSVGRTREAGQGRAL